MRARKITFTTFNLYNLNQPGRRMYRKDGWSELEYRRKVEWTSFMMRHAAADVYGFQELWDTKALEEALAGAQLEDEYVLLAPPDHAGGSIVNAAVVHAGMLEGEARWVTDFPPAFALRSGGDDAQTPDIAVEIGGFSRPVLHFRIRPREDREPIHVFVAHFKSKRPTDIYFEGWYRADVDLYRNHRTAIGAGLSTIRRTAEAVALRIIITEALKGTNTPAVVLGDLNDGQHSNTLNILTEQPRYLSALSFGGGDTALYSGQTLQQYRSERDVYYTHVYQGARESLDHVLVSEELYDNSRDRVWAFDQLEIYNDHLNREEHADEWGTNDHGIVRATFRYRPNSGD